MHINFSNREIEEIDLNTFTNEDEELQTLSVVSSIDLSNNRIRVISNFTSFSNLKHLNLSHNRLTNLCQLPFFLVTLDISHNFLLDLSGMKNCAELIVLNVSNNRLGEANEKGCLQSRHLKTTLALKEINLSNNKLRGLEGIQNLKLLKKVDVSCNLISDFSRVKVLEVLTIEEFKIQDNPITQDTQFSSQLIAMVPSLNILDGTTLPKRPQSAMGPRKLNLSSSSISSYIKSQMSNPSSPRSTTSHSLSVSSITTSVKSFQKISNNSKQMPSSAQNAGVPQQVQERMTYIPATVSETFALIDEENSPVSSSSKNQSPAFDKSIDMNLTEKPYVETPSTMPKRSVGAKARMGFQPIAAENEQASSTSDAKSINKDGTSRSVPDLNYEKPANNFRQKSFMSEIPQRFGGKDEFNINGDPVKAFHPAFQQGSGSNSASRGRRSATPQQQHQSQQQQQQIFLPQTQPVVGPAQITDEEVEKTITSTESPEKWRRKCQELQQQLVQLQKMVNDEDTFNTESEKELKYYKQNFHQLQAINKQNLQHIQNLQKFQTINEEEIKKQKERASKYMRNYKNLQELLKNQKKKREDFENEKRGYEKTIQQLRNDLANERKRRTLLARLQQDLEVVLKYVAWLENRKDREKEGNLALEPKNVPQKVENLQNIEEDAKQEIMSLTSSVSSIGPDISPEKMVSEVASDRSDSPVDSEVSSIISQRFAGQEGEEFNDLEKHLSLIKRVKTVLEKYEQLNSPNATAAALTREHEENLNSQPTEEAKKQVLSSQKSSPSVKSSQISKNKVPQSVGSSPKAAPLSPAPSSVVERPQSPAPSVSRPKTPISSARSNQIESKTKRQDLQVETQTELNHSNFISAPPTLASASYLKKATQNNTSKQKIYASTEQQTEPEDKRKVNTGSRYSSTQSLNILKENQQETKKKEIEMQTEEQEVEMQTEEQEIEDLEAEEQEQERIKQLEALNKQKEKEKMEMKKDSGRNSTNSSYSEEGKEVLSRNNDRSAENNTIQLSGNLSLSPKEKIVIAIQGSAEKSSISSPFSSFKKQHKELNELLQTKKDKLQDEYENDIVLEVESSGSSNNSSFLSQTEKEPKKQQISAPEPLKDAEVSKRVQKQLQPLNPQLQTSQRAKSSPLLSIGKRFVDQTPQNTLIIQKTPEKETKFERSSSISKNQEPIQPKVQEIPSSISKKQEPIQPKVQESSFASVQMMLKDAVKVHPPFESQEIEELQNSSSNYSKKQVNFDGPNSDLSGMNLHYNNNNNFEPNENFTSKTSYLMRNTPYYETKLTRDKYFNASPKTTNETSRRRKREQMVKNAFKERLDRVRTNFMKERENQDMEEEEEESYDDDDDEATSKHYQNNEELMSKKDLEFSKRSNNHNPSSRSNVFLNVRKGGDLSPTDSVSSFSSSVSGFTYGGGDEQLKNIEDLSVMDNTDAISTLTIEHL